MLAIALALAMNVLTAEEKAAGWQLLFDGKSFAGWEDPKRKDPPGDSWTIEEGCLKARSRPQRRDDLLTLDTFDDFELRFEWRISPRGNSGVKYRIQDRFYLDERRILEFKRFEDLANDAIRRRATPRAEATQEYIVGFEYQVIDDSGHADARRGAYYQAGALYDMIAPAKANAKPVGEFNEARIVVRGTRIEHWLNGEKVLEGDLRAEAIRQRVERRWTSESPIYDLLVRQPKRATPIGLQNHNDEAWFRNIKIRRLR
jgi:hypothetical protein